MTKTVWVAGFAHNRAATRIHDDLKAVAAVIDDGEHRIGLVALDAIGFFHDEVLAVRRSLPSSARLDYVVVASTHNHSAPDLMGIWGPSDFRSGIDPEYRTAVVAGAAGALLDAVEALTPVVGVVRGGAARSRRTRGRFPRPAGLRRHAAADALHARRRLDGRHGRQLGQSSRNALGGQHRVDRGFSRLPARHARGGRDAGRPPGRGWPRRHARLRERRDRRADDHQPADDRGRSLHAAVVHRAVARQGARAGAPAGASGAGRGARRRGRGADRAANRVRRPHAGTEHRQHAVPARQRVGALRARAAAAEPHSQRSRRSSRSAMRASPACPASSIRRLPTAASSARPARTSIWPRWRFRRSGS